MSVKIISETKQSITLEVVINFDNENFDRISGENKIMNLGEGIRLAYASAR